MRIKCCKTWLGGLIKFSTITWFVCHFVLTIGYVLPLNPLKMRFQPVLDATIGTYFPQNWSLFAPNPVSHDDALLVRCLSQTEVLAIQDMDLPTSGWRDLSTPLWERFHKKRLSAYDRLGRPQSNAIREYLTGGSYLQPWMESCQKGSEESCKIYQEHLKVAQSNASAILAKVGSAFCRDISPPGAYTHVALRVRQTAATPWSERYTGKRMIQDYDLGIYPIDMKVVTTGLYKMEASK